VTGPQRQHDRRPHQVRWSTDEWAVLSAAADALDLPTSTLVRAVVEGAVRTAQVDRLAAIALADEAPQRRPRRIRSPWVRADEDDGRRVGTGLAPIPPVRWRTEGGWITWRRGRSGNGQVQGIDGWFLSGPGIAEPEWMGFNRTDALSRANDRIAALEAE
jgi:hypothetical protein